MNCNRKEFMIYGRPSIHDEISKANYLETLLVLDNIDFQRLRG